jgi:hypothetical protein
MQNWPQSDSGYTMPDRQAADRQAAYAQYRKTWTEQWHIANAEDFCARMEVDPQTGKWLAPPAD